MKFTTNSNQETIKLGEKIGKALIGGEIFLLEGDLGAGKTQFTKGLAKGLGIEEEVISPTFTIERIYEGRLNLHHFDFYRLDNNDPELTEEVLDLQNDKLNVLVFEWPDNLEKALPNERIIIKLSYKDEEVREIEIMPTEKYNYILENL